jgi:hypothetical protein
MDQTSRDNSTSSRQSETSQAATYDNMTSALFVAVPAITTEKSTTFYTVVLRKAYDQEDNVKYLKRRFSEFEKIHKELTQIGFHGIPPLPSKYIIQMDSNLEQRRKDLQVYMRTLVNRTEIRNSLPMIAFLELDQFCPEMIY